MVDVTAFHQRECHNHYGLMNHFAFSTSEKIIFGRGEIKKLPELVSNLGDRVLAVTGSRTDSVDLIENLLSSVVSSLHYYHISNEPAVETIQTGREIALDVQADLVIGVGGGSVIDSAKAIAALATNPGDIFDYLEIIGKNQPIRLQPLPIIAIPTTSGTGTEVTRNAVIGSKVHARKVSLRHPLLLPRIALVDPELTLTMPPHVTANTGMDAITQLIEPYVSHHHNPITDALSRDGIRRGVTAIIDAYRDGMDIDARSEMALASLFGGIAFTNASLGAVHGIAGPFGGNYDAPHGAICGRLLPGVMKFNIQAMLAREPRNPALARYDEIAVLLTGNQFAHAQAGVERVAEIVDLLGIPHLSSYGFNQSDADELAARSHTSSSMKGNPIYLTQDEIRHILEEAL